MRLMVVGSDRIDAIENFFIKHLRNLGVDVFLSPSYVMFHDYYNRSIVNKILFRAGLSRIYDKINRQLLAHVDAFKPEIVWVFKGMEIYPATLEKIRSKGILTANYNPDNPFIFSSRGSGNSNVARSIRLFDLHFTYNLDVKARLAGMGLKTALLPFAYEVSDEHHDACIQQQEVLRVCFLGNPDKLRADFLQALADTGIEIDVYGHHWEQFVKRDNIQIHKPVYGDGFWKVLWRYRVQINLMRIHNLDSHNMRSFEIPGIGGIMVAPHTTEHRMFFEDKKEAFFFKEVEDCAAVIKQLLAADRATADNYRIYARKRSLLSGYRYKDRARTVFNVFSKLLAGEPLEG
jgi:spore maturation protein CgeB